MLSALYINYLRFITSTERSYGFCTERCTSCATPTVVWFGSRRCSRSSIATRTKAVRSSTLRSAVASLALRPGGDTTTRIPPGSIPIPLVRLVAPLDMRIRAGPAEIRSKEKIFGGIPLGSLQWTPATPVQTLGAAGPPPVSLGRPTDERRAWLVGALAVSTFE